MNERHVGRQPIIDGCAKIAAYDLLYREQGHNGNEGLTASVISNLLGTFGIGTILGRHVGFVRVDGEFLENDLMHTLPKETIVYSLLSGIDITETVLLRLERLWGEGYRFALNDTAYTAETLLAFAPLLPYLSFVKIDPSISDLKLLGTEIARLHEMGLKIIGAKIETNDIYDLCRSMGFDYFQGYFIAQPNVIKNMTFSPEQQGVLELWNLLQSDCEIPELVRAFERHPTIALKLLQFINSAAFALRNPVSSISQVLTLMGRDPLSKWIMLMLFAEGEKSPQSRAPLLLMVINRTELMSAVAEMLDPSIAKEEKAKAYFVGMLSLIHLLFQMPQREVLAKINVSDEIRTALLEGTGFYGELLDVVRSIELFDTKRLEAFFGAKGFTLGAVEALIGGVMEIVNTFERGMES